MTRRNRRRLAWLLTALALLAGCVDQQKPKPLTPAEVRAQVARLLPVTIPDRKGWAADIQAAFAALAIEPTAQNLCSVLAVTEQESTFAADPAVPGLGKIARAEIDRRAARLHVPQLVVHGAMQIESPDGRTWDERIAAARTEKELSGIFEELIDSVPMGRRLLANSNPVHTGGPMQVSIGFAEQHVRDRPYPYAVEGSSIRHEVFTRRGGMYFGIAHLLGYPAPYKQPLYRFADFNAGWYASRNAAFQQAVTIASGIPLILDGDVVRYRKQDGSDVGATEVAVRSLAQQLGMSDAQIHRALMKADSSKFERTPLYEKVFAMAEQMERRILPRAVMPRIDLASPKITRKLTTEWFATRVDQRYRRCMLRTSQG